MANKDESNNSKINNATVDSDLQVDHDESYDSPVWFWCWMLGLVLLFFVFGYINKVTSPDNESEQAQVSVAMPQQTVSSQQTIPVVKQ